MTPSERAKILRDIARGYDKLRVVYNSMAMWTEDENGEAIRACVETIAMTEEKIIELQAEVYL